MTKRAVKRRTILAGTLGNALEWYDFAIYGFMAPILGQAFFPAEDKVASLLAAFGVFAVGYAARPVGAILFGHLGDRFGRKPALLISMISMGATSLAIGLMPDHSQIGTAAAFVLVTLRVIQGLSVGGEYGSSIVFMAEHAPPARRAFFASLPQCGSLSGFLVGSALSSFIAGQVGNEAMVAWGWRIPFLFGALAAVFGIILRSKLTEPPGITRLDRGAGLPLVVALSGHWRTMLRLVILMMGGGIGFYLMAIYAASYLTEQMHLSTAKALEINTLGLLAMLLVTPPAAILSDRIGRNPMLYGVAIGGLVLGWPLWWLMHQDAFALIVAGQIGLALIFGVTFAVVPAVITEHLPSQIRCSGASVSYNFCLGLFGGTTPLVATYLVARTADDFAPIYYFMAVALLQFIALIGLKEMAGKPLS
ncbi:MAG: MFS transporter [Pseudomonadota bacterium]